MSPADASRSSAEMKTAYFILAVPEWVKVITIVACLGLVVFFPLSIVRKKISAILIFNENSIEIKSNKNNLDLVHSNISEIIFNDLKDHTGFPKGRLQIAIHFKGKALPNSPKVVFFLNDYTEGGSFIDSVGKISNIDSKMYDFTSPESIE